MTVDSERLTIASMPRITRLAFVLFSLVGMPLARGADIATTHHFTADLSQEGNRAVTATGLGWPAIVAVNAVVVAAFGACTLYWWRRPLRLTYPPEPATAWRFASFNYLGEACDGARFARRLLVARPRNWPMAFQLVGVVAPVGLIGASGLAVFSWFALYQWRWSAYRWAYRELFPAFPYALLLPLGMWATVVFFRGEWSRHRGPLDSQSAGHTINLRSPF